MKNYNISFALIFAIQLLIITNLSAQKSTGINNKNPNIKSSLDIRTTSGFKQGFLMPRLVGADTTAIGATVGKDHGLMFFDTLIGDVRFWDGTKWKGGEGGNSSNIWSKSGTSIYPTTLTNYVGIGTNNPTSLLTIGKNFNLFDSSSTGFNGMSINAVSNGTGNFNYLNDGTATFMIFDQPYTGFYVFPSGTKGTAIKDYKMNLKVTPTGVGIGVDGVGVTLDMKNGKDAVNMPNGTTLERPSSPNLGAFRYNTDLSTFEGYNGTSWNSFQTGVTSSPWTQSGTTISNSTGTNQVNINYTGQVGLQLNGSDASWSSLYINGITGAGIGFGYNRGGIFKGGLYLNSTDDWTVQLWDGTSTKTRLYVKSSTGNIGIGTTPTLSEKLTVMNDLYGFSHINSANTVKMSSYIGNSYTTTSIPGASVGTQTDHPFFIYVNNNAEKFYIGNSTQNYNVGIGTNLPQSRLHIVGGEFRVENNPNDAGSGRMRLIGNTQSATTSFTLGQHSTGEAFLWNDAPNRMSFGTSNSEKMVILANGNVGIGLALPNAPLQFPNAIANRKIVLYEGFNNDHQYYGFGINGGTLRYQTDATAADHVFYSASSATSSTELMRIMGAGNIGIGTSSPAHRLTVTGGLINAIYVGSSNLFGSAQTSSQLILQSGTGLFFFPQMNPEWTLSVSDNDPAAGQTTDGYLVFSRRTASNVNPTKLMVLDNNSLNPFADGGMALGAAAYRWSTVFATTGTINTSDRRSKKDIQPIKYGLNEVLKLQPISFKWKNDSLNTNKLGLIAQDLEKILPEVVVPPKSPNEQYGVYYSDMIPVLVKAIQEHQKMIESLQSEIKSLKK